MGEVRRPQEREDEMSRPARWRKREVGRGGRLEVAGGERRDRPGCWVKVLAKARKKMRERERENMRRMESSSGDAEPPPMRG